VSTTVESRQWASSFTMCRSMFARFATTLGIAFPRTARRYQSTLEIDWMRTSRSSAMHAEQESRKGFQRCDTSRESVSSLRVNVVLQACLRSPMLSSSWHERRRKRGAGTRWSFSPIEPAPRFSDGNWWVRCPVRWTSCEGENCRSSHRPD